MDQKYKQNFIKAGQLAKEVREYGKSLIKKGASYNEVIFKIKQKIHELKALPAFPPQIALNTVAAHFLPHPNSDIIFKDDVVKLDVGVCYDGAIGDTAVTIDLSGKYQKLIEAAEAALLEAEKIIQVGLPCRSIGKTIEKTINSYGFKPIKNLSGHGLGLNQIHTYPSIPNYDDGSNAIIKKGMTFAIEPFATNGKGLIYEAKDPMIFAFQGSKKIPSKKAVTLLKKIEGFKGLPFSMHDLLEKDLHILELETLFNELQKTGTIIGYPPLLEEGPGMVAQAENSVLVDDKGNVFVTTR